MGPQVLIPFIAGQWSLLRSPPAARRRGKGLNPLHCGAVVASGWRLVVRDERRDCLNPLHCGAVVASFSRRRPLRRRRCVLIPFIAGQWSLLDPDPPDDDKDES